jgi:hypothetical protein
LPFLFKFSSSARERPLPNMVYKAECLMPPDRPYIVRALEYAELAREAEDFDARECLRELALCWLRLADYARQKQAPAADAAAS